jgi:hypothetical protein
MSALLLSTAVSQRTQILVDGVHQCLDTSRLAQLHPHLTFSHLVKRICKLARQSSLRELSRCARVVDLRAPPPSASSQVAFQHLPLQEVAGQ